MTLTELQDLTRHTTLKVQVSPELKSRQLTLTKSVVGLFIVIYNGIASGKDYINGIFISAEEGISHALLTLRLEELLDAEVLCRSCEETLSALFGQVVILSQNYNNLQKTLAKIRTLIRALSQNVGIE
jgi:hypothetical protein